MTHSKPVDQAQLHDSIVRQLYRRSGATGQIQLPAVPGLIDAHLRELLAGQLPRRTRPRLAR